MPQQFVEKKICSKTINLNCNTKNLCLSWIVGVLLGNGGHLLLLERCLSDAGIHNLLLRFFPEQHHDKSNMEIYSNLLQSPQTLAFTISYKYYL